MRASGAAARTFRLDVKGAELREALRDAGVRSILLKGRAFADLLYADRSERDYSDVDLLIAADDARTARNVLRRAGFVPFDREAPSGQTDPGFGKLIGAQGAVHGGAWYRPNDGVTIDLHHSLPQVFAERDVVWREVTKHVVVMDVGGARTEVLDPPASALLVALHAAHHGPRAGAALADLERATQHLDPACWQQARTLATSLDAETAMGIGLGLSARGCEIAQELGLPTTPGAGLRLLWSGAPWGSSFLASLAEARGSDRIALLLRVAAPSPRTLRHGSALARRGALGLAAAYVVRLTQLAWQLPAAVAAWRRLGSRD